MASVNGTTKIMLEPLAWAGSNTHSVFEPSSQRTNYLLSANSPIRYIVQWTRGGLLDTTIPSQTGDVVNAIFEIKESMENIPYSDMRTVATIRKSRDVPNMAYGGVTYNESGNFIAGGHQFSLDISSIASDLLSYSLVPINKGTFQTYKFGGLNGGGTPQDNYIGGSPNTQVSQYRLSLNGAARRIDIEVKFEVLDSNGNLTIATNGSLTMNTITVINSAEQWEEDTVNLQDYIIKKSQYYKFLNNFSSTIKKPVREEDQAEWLYFYIHNANDTAYGVSNEMGLKVETFTSAGAAENTFYINEFKGLLDIEVGGELSNLQRKVLAQNVSPYFIENTAAAKEKSDEDLVSYAGSKITSSTSYYRVSLSKIQLTNPYNERRATEYKYYIIDREPEHPYGYVRFHWLNRKGGIDSYTAKRDVVEGIGVDRNTFERKSPDKLWLQNTSAPSTNYYDDNMRGDLYKGGAEVLNVNANRNHSVYTEPLNKDDAKWLEEIITSPNVWIEHQSEATERRNTQNSYLRPSTKGYIPIVITNSDAETVNQESGLVKFNIEFTHSHSINTQRN